MFKHNSQSWMTRITSQTAVAALLAFGAAGVAQAETITGALEEGDTVVDGYTDTIEIEASEGDMLLIDLMSDDFDAYLSVVTPSGAEYFDDDSGEGLNSRLMVTADEAGTFLVTISSYYDDSEGAYELSYETLELNDGTPTTISADGETLIGELVAGDGFNEHGSFFDLYEVEIEEGMNILFSLESEEFDPLLALITPSGEEITNDDFGESFNAGLVMETEESGTYSFYATSFNSGETGGYTLRYVVSEEPFGGEAQPLTSDADVIVGEIAEGDAILPGGKLVDVFALEMEPGNSVMVRLESDDFDTFLRVTSPSGEEFTNDDYGDSLNSGLMLTASEAGAYEIEVSGYSASARGAYMLDYTLSEEPFGGPVVMLDPSEISLEGELDLGDGARITGELYDAYSLELSEGDTLVVSLDSDMFDAFLTVVMPDGAEVINDDFGDDLNAAIITDAPVDGTYIIQASSYSAGETGPYVLTYMVSDEGMSGETVTLNEVSGTIEGELDLGDGFQSDDNTLFDTYEIAVDEGETLIVSLSSDMFDSYLTLISPSGEEFYNDDFGASYNSRIAQTATERGVYTILASSFGPNESGPYELTYSVSDEPLGGAPVELTSDGGTIAGELSFEDGIGEGGAFEDRYTLTVEAGQRIIVDMESEDFDTFLHLITPSGDELSNDDYEGSLAHSRIERTAFEAGTYTIVTTAYSEGEYGDYFLIYDISANNPNEIIEGTLEDGDELGEGGQFTDTFEIEAVAGDEIIIDLYSSEFDTYLSLIAPDGTELENHDYSGLGHSRLEDRARVDGTYIVTVSSYDAGETGGYFVEYSQEEGEVWGGPVTPVSPVPYGQAIAGTLDEQDDLHIDGQYRDAYAFEASEGEALIFDLFSSTFDSYLTVITPSGEEVTNDDFNGSVDHSHVEVIAEEAGEYVVIVTSFSQDETGDYYLVAADRGLY
ncbi:PPC domain-containing protein [Ponticaulis sp.]|uniref:PPC domain-containing protein n=1 Tax=Ponticaulis sp. TaxID=2020902 RepID=UPI000B72B024|nr:PPC domain-containing protein [Ponticaulis sp.]MAI90232.1 hypothetical protein [Ponticaulis sp.]OUX99878.1 MAG: hypothetical protein CBB65_07310 [Hyphomonadaceae bacterium TMED5]